jgi:hypothetical protein
MSFRDRLAGMTGQGLLAGMTGQGLLNNEHVQQLGGALGNTAANLIPGGQLIKGFGSKLMNRRRAAQQAGQDDLASAGMDPGMSPVGYPGSTAIDPSVAMQDPMLIADVNGRQFEPVSPMTMKGDLDKDGKMSSYEQARQTAIEKNMKKQ